MFSFKKTLCALIACALLASLCGCGKTEENVTDSKQETPIQNESQNISNQEPKETAEEIQALVSVALEKLSVVPEYPEGYPTLEDVVEQYEKANMAVGWIVGTESVPTYESDTIVVNGLTYQRVKPDCHYGEHKLNHHAAELGETEKLIYDKETLEAYLATLIHPDEAREYIIDIKESFDISKLVEAKNGALYALPYPYLTGGYGTDDTYELTKNSDGSYTFTVGYTLLNDDGTVRSEKSRKFGYVNVDGRWVFENFVVIKQ